VVKKVRKGRCGVCGVLRELFPFQRWGLCGRGLRGYSSDRGRSRCLWSTGAARMSTGLRVDDLVLWVGEVAAPEGAWALQGVGAGERAACFLWVRCATRFALHGC